MPCTMIGSASNQVSYFAPAPQTIATTLWSKPSGKTASSTSNQYCSAANTCVVNKKMPRSRSCLLSKVAPHKTRLAENKMSSDEDSSLLPSSNCAGPLAHECPAYASM